MQKEDHDFFNENTHLKKLKKFCQDNNRNIKNILKYY